MFGRVGCVSLFSKNYHHLIILLLFFGYAVCVQICVLLFCLFSTSDTAYWPVQVLNQRTFDVSLFNLQKPLFWLNSNLTKFANIFLGWRSFPKKARKRMRTSIETIIYTELCLPHHEHHHILSKSFNRFWNQFLFTMKSISVGS